MQQTGMDVTAMAVHHLRTAAGGSDPWTESHGARRSRGGFAWHDAQGNGFDVLISLTTPAPRTQEERETAGLASAWQVTMLGDDSAHSTDPAAWNFAAECRSTVLAMRAWEKE